MISSTFIDFIQSDIVKKELGSLNINNSIFLTNLLNTIDNVTKSISDISLNNSNNNLILLAFKNATSYIQTILSLPSIPDDNQNHDLNLIKIQKQIKEESSISLNSVLSNYISHDLNLPPTLNHINWEGYENILEMMSDKLTIKLNTINNKIKYSKNKTYIKKQQNAIKIYTFVKSNLSRLPLLINHIQPIHFSNEDFQKVTDQWSKIEKPIKLVWNDMMKHIFQQFISSQQHNYEFDQILHNYLKHSLVLPSSFNIIIIGPIYQSLFPNNRVNVDDFKMLISNQQLFNNMYHIFFDNLKDKHEKINYKMNKMTDLTNKRNQLYTPNDFENLSIEQQDKILNNSIHPVHSKLSKKTKKHTLMDLD
jgi:hypothetical protein